MLAAKPTALEPLVPCQTGRNQESSSTSSARKQGAQSPQMCHLTLRNAGEIIEINANFEKHPTSAELLSCYPARFWAVAGVMHHNYYRPQTDT